MYMEDLQAVKIIKQGMDSVEIPRYFVEMKHKGRAIKVEVTELMLRKECVERLSTLINQ